MTTKEQTMTMAFTYGILGGLIVRSFSLAAGVAVAILLLAALFSTPIPAMAGADSAPGKPVAPMANVAQDALIILR